MKKILILYPHFPPSNLAGVHRPRLFAQHLPAFGWTPVVLTVHENYYEENPDWNLVKLLPADLRIEKVSAFRVGKLRLVGDIGLRAFFQLYKKAKQLIINEGFDFLYIPIPSFYCALLGRMLHKSTRIKYGIDYIDPWVHHFPGSDKMFSRHWFSTKLAGLLEPLAVKKASMITGVAEGYYEDVLKRNPSLKKTAVTGGMPYGGEISDHESLQSIDTLPYLFSKKEGVVKLVYAGAMLPKAYTLLEKIFQSISENRPVFEKIEFHFIGTGSRADDENSFNIKPFAERYNLYNIIIYEYPKRIPYLDVLVHLKIADGIFILGSTEPHYTPSKTYQAVLSGKYIMAVLHNASTAVKAIQQSGAGIVLSFDGEQDVDKVSSEFTNLFKEWKLKASGFQPSQVNFNLFNQYSAKAVTQTLAGLLDQAIANP